ncbi:9595_t:CDS:2 [Scutellospora calospora]|uniref:9595_t:CDS:1 n=1 Tax=Scutellospora calospora TaxID=85575 RepID=A0ACA9LM06_9GLOM|nr:9595_t:CDS:2 [Scutellospora calospora]
MDEQQSLAKDCELTESKGESLLDPINRLKELLHSQSSILNIDVLESDLQNHNSPKATPVETSPSVSENDYTNSTYLETKLNTSNTLQASSSNNDILNLTLKKRRVPPVALISADIRQIRSRAQRINAYSAKFELLKQEDAGLRSWLNLNIIRELPLTIKNYKKRFNETLPSIASLAANKIYSSLSLAMSTSSQPTLSSRIPTDISIDTNLSAFSSSQSPSKTLSSPRTFLDIAVQANSPKGHSMSPPMSPKMKTSTNFFNLNRRGSISRPTIHMPPAVMNDPSANSSASSIPSSPKSPKIISSKRQRRFSFQAVSSKFHFGSSNTSSLTFPTIEEKTDINLSNSVVVDEDALNRLCDVLPHADRDVLIKYLRAAGGKDDLMAVGLYMKDLKSGEI